MQKGEKHNKRNSKSVTAKTAPQHVAAVAAAAGAATATQANFHRDAHTKGMQREKTRGNARAAMKCLDKKPSNNIISKDDAIVDCNDSTNREAEQIEKELEEFLQYPLNIDDCIKRLTAYKGGVFRHAHQLRELGGGRASRYPRPNGEDHTVAADAPRTRFPRQNRR